METLIGLQYEIQILLFAGYCGYKTSVIGRGITHRTEEFFLQVVVFGSIGRIGAALADLAVNSARGQPLSPNAALALTFLAALAAAVLAAGVWRSKLLPHWGGWMVRLGFYRDDHQSSVWSSILEAKTIWKFIQIHTDDGRVYEADFGKFPADLPMADITLNDDGIATYITRIWSSNDKPTDCDPVECGKIITYIPRSRIRQIEIGWEKSF